MHGTRATALEGGLSLPQPRPPKPLQVMRPVHLALERHLARQPGQREVRLGAEQRCQRYLGRFLWPDMPSEAVSTRWAPTKSLRWRSASREKRIASS